VALLIGVAAIVTPVLLDLSLRLGLPRWVTIMFSALGGLLTASVYWLTSRIGTPRTALDPRARLLERVRLNWIEGFLEEQSLYREVRLELGLVEEAEYVSTDWSRNWDVIVQRPDRPPQSLAPGTAVIEVFDAVGGQILILGEPGSGKTTLLLELGRDLLARAQRDPAYATPVVLNLSTWGSGGKRTSLEDWLVAELHTRYGVGQDLADEWVRTDALLPLLDGLDEVAPTARGAAVKAINEFRREHGLVRLAVCSRTAEYEALKKQLHLQAALVIQPLTRQQVLDFIAGFGESLVGLGDALKGDERLCDLLRTPLMLTITVATYRVTPPQLGRDGSTESQRDRLFQRYVTAMFRRRSKRFRYSQQQTERWLGMVARGLDYQSIFNPRTLDWIPSAHDEMRDFVAPNLLGLIGALVGLALLPTERFIGRTTASALVGLVLGLTLQPVLRRGIRCAFYTYRHGGDPGQAPIVAPTAGFAGAAVTQLLGNGLVANGVGFLVGLTVLAMAGLLDIQIGADVLALIGMMAVCAAVGALVADRLGGGLVIVVLAGALAVSLGVGAVRAYLRRYYPPPRDVCIDPVVAMTSMLCIGVAFTLIIGLPVLLVTIPVVVLTGLLRGAAHWSSALLLPVTSAVFVLSRVYKGRPAREKCSSSARRSCGRYRGRPRRDAGLAAGPRNGCRPCRQCCRRRRPEKSINGPPSSGGALDYRAERAGSLAIQKISRPCCRPHPAPQGRQ